MQNLLKITFSIPTFNSQKDLERCLNSIVSQDYPKHNIEIIITDAGSSDATRAIAEKYTHLIYDNPMRLGEYGTQIAARHATGDLFVVFAADNGLVGADWIQKVVSFFMRNPGTSCLWGKMIASKDDSWVMRYYELIQSEPLAHFLNKNQSGYLAGASNQNNDGMVFALFTVIPQRPLCWGANGLVYRLAAVKDLYQKEGYTGDNDLFQYMVEKGNDRVAYAPGLHIYHHTVSSVWHWVKKWKRNYTQIFLKTRGERRIDWFYCGNFKLKMCAWVAYSMVPVFSIAHALILMVRDKNIFWAYHPLMCFLQTTTYLFWTFALPEGRKAFFEHLRVKNYRGACA